MFLLLTLFGCATKSTLRAKVPEIPNSEVDSKWQNEVDEIAKEWRNLDFDVVVQHADRVLPSVSGRLRLELLRFKGAALVVMKEYEAAILVFEKIFKVNINYELPRDTSPRILEIFRPAKARYQVKEAKRLATEFGESYKAIRLDISLPKRSHGGIPLRLRFAMVDPGRLVSEITLFYRRRGDRRYSTISRERIEKLTFVIPASVTASDKSYVLEYFFQVKHRSGSVIRQHGAWGAPRALQMKAGFIQHKKAIYKRWWFLPSSAVVIASAIVIPLFLTRDVGPQTILVTEQ